MVGSTVVTVITLNSEDGYTISYCDSTTNLGSLISGHNWAFALVGIGRRTDPDFYITFNIEGINITFNIPSIFFATERRQMTHLQGIKYIIVGKIESFEQLGFSIPMYI